MLPNPSLTALLNATIQRFGLASTGMEQESPRTIELADGPPSMLPSGPDSPTEPEMVKDSVRIGLEVNNRFRAEFLSEVKKAFGRPVTAAVSMFIVTLAAALFAIAVPAHAGLIVSSWIGLCLLLMVLTWLDHQDPSDSN